MSLAVRTLLCLNLTGILLASLPAAVDAQVGIRGVIRSPGGNGISSAQVTAESIQTGETRSTTTNDSGRFALIDLDSGQWRLVIEADGYQQARGFASVSRVNPDPTNVDLTLDLDPLNPPPPEAGVLAGLRSTDLISSLDTADQLVENGDYDAAIEVYRSIVDLVPALSSIYLQIGHAFLAKQQPDEALAAYQTALAADQTNVAVLAAIEAVRRSAP